MALNVDRSRRYREDGRRRWERMRAAMIESGAVDADQLDGTPASLRVVWGWVLPQLRRRPVDATVDPARQPPWWDGPYWNRYAAWDDTAHDLVGAVADYVGEVVSGQPGATWSLGAAGSRSEGEPVVVVERQPEINPVGLVLHALADLEEGQPEPEALVSAVERHCQALPLQLLYPTRLVLRLRGPAAGLLRRRCGLPRDRVSEGLGRLLGRDAAVDLPVAGTVMLEHIGAGDWRAGIEVEIVPDAVRAARVVIGAPWDVRPHERPEHVAAFLHGLLQLAAGAGGQLEIEHAQPPELDAPRPTGLLTPENVAEVLQAVELGSRRRPR